MLTNISVAAIMTAASQAIWLKLLKIIGWTLHWVTTRLMCITKVLVAAPSTWRRSSVAISKSSAWLSIPRETSSSHNSHSPALIGKTKSPLGVAAQMSSTSSGEMISIKITIVNTWMKMEISTTHGKSRRLVAQESSQMQDWAATTISSRISNSSLGAKALKTSMREQSLMFSHCVPGWQLHR